MVSRLVAVLVLTARALAFDMSQCIAPLGMESGLIPDKDITASSCYNDGNVAPQNGRLNQDIAGGAWCPLSQITTEATEWLEVDLHGVHVLTAVGTQGRFGNGQGQEFAEAYVLEYWRPRLGKWLRYRAPDGQEVLPGNSNTYLEQKNQLARPVWASKVRFIPRSAHRRTVCMRVEIYGCPWTVGIVSYSIPKGDKRSNGVELSDASYDGAWTGGELRGGLGELVDGRYGGDELRDGGWIGWKNESRARPPHLLVEFDRVREFTALHIHTSNKFTRDVRVFSSAVVWFSVGGAHFQEEPVRYTHASDHIFESARNVSLNLHHRIARFVRIELHFAARWILVSEIVFDSDVAQGNYTAERQRESGLSREGVRVVSETRGVTTGEVRTDPVFAAVVVGVATALAILVGVAVAVLVHRHRHRKCTPSHARAPDREPYHPPPEDTKCSDYQEPYQALRCAPYFAYSTVLVDNYAHDKHHALSESSVYEYAVPELSSAPLLDGVPDQDRCSDINTCSSGSEVTRRAHSAAVSEFPRHRLRMISKLAEGAFGTVFVAEAEGVPGYGGEVSPESRLVAVKLLAPDAAHTDREQFERDVRVLSSLSHARLSRVVGVCRSPPPAVVVEYLSGGDLCSFLRAADPPPLHHQLLHLAEQLADGMRYLESLNFVHRDLAARNCLVGPGYQLKIGDLGTDCEAFASAYCRVGRCGASVPLRWSAWEAALLGHYSTASDAWAFAVTLYEIFTLCRRTPYAHLTDSQVVENLSHLEADDGGFERLERPAGCPRDLYHLMAGCWRRDHRHRPTFAEAHQLLQRKTLMLSST